MSVSQEAAVHLLISTMHASQHSKVMTVKVLHLNVRLVQDSKRRVLEGDERGVFEVFKDDLKWQFRGGAFKTVDCKKMNQVKLRA